MNSEHQVTSLEPSKRLRVLGVPQDSYFCWDKIKYGEYTIMKSPAVPEIRDCFSAYTVAELGEMLPAFYATRRISDSPERWEAFRTFATKASAHEEQADTEADARAAMLIYLLENKLI